MIRCYAITCEACIIQTDGDATGLWTSTTRVARLVAVRADLVVGVTLTSSHHGVLVVGSIG